ncbi:DEAD/DEAH box helicase family protein [Shewanella pneumatophori]|uniref:DEAD/DEAH box helicase family protein n=1 Tax=Shewanella pneumatophori TaxID=314092 RepID=A0A9X1ZJV4_9GAMM|nr:DEAD/DEAH box helicase family protein [Shewanella pneumatophori]MCL1139123.1 DEAD/DEAH box helicase family protein [Shewanella pneumatophori]
MKTNTTQHTVNLKVVDAMMGAGKSTAIQQYMKDKALASKFVYVSPLLSELERFQQDCPELNFQQPTSMGRSKKDSFMDLILNGYNVVTTHATLQNLSHSDADEINAAGYILVIDEAVEAIKVPPPLGRHRLRTLIESEALSVAADGLITWNCASFPIAAIDDAREKALAEDCCNQSLYLIGGETLIHQYPISILSSFEEVICMTYLWEGTIFAHYCRIHDIKPQDITHEIALMRNETELKQIARDNIKLFEPKKDTRASLTQTWWSKARPTVIKPIAALITSFVTNRKLTSKNILITCPKDNWVDKDENGQRIKSGKAKAKGAKYSKSLWVASTCRATNDYADKTAVIYALSKFENPAIYNHCKNKGVSFNKDKYALAEMLQLIWRGCIRKGEPMHLFIVCPRMRKLFKNWLNESDNKMLA